MRNIFLCIALCATMTACAVDAAETDPKQMDVTNAAETFSIVMQQLEARDCVPVSVFGAKLHEASRNGEYEVEALVGDYMAIARSHAQYGISYDLNLKLFFERTIRQAVRSSRTSDDFGLSVSLDCEYYVSTNCLYGCDTGFTKIKLPDFIIRMH